MQIILQKTIIIQEQGEPFNFHIVSVKDKTHIQLCHELVSWLFMPKYCNQSTIICANPPYIVTNPPFLLKKGVVAAWRVS